jgi:predicted RND superfamily exporter protein
MWHRIAGFILKYRIALLSILLVITSVMGYYASKVELSYEFTRAIPTDNPKYQDYQHFRQQFGEDGNMMVIGLQTDRFFEQDFLKDYTALVHKLEKVEGVKSIISVPTAVNLVKDTANNKLQVVRLTQDNQPMVAADVKQVFYNLPFYKGFLYNPETNTYLMAVSIDKDILNSIKRNTVVEGITVAADKFGEEHKVTMHYSGLPLIRTIMATKVQSELKMFLVLSLILTAVILALFFRSWVAVVSSMLVVAVGVIWSMATIHLCGYKISLLTGLIPPLIVVIGIPNCVYFLNKYHTEFAKHGNKQQALLTMVDRMGIVTLFTNLTAAIGFGVFFFTKSAILKEFGLVAGINLIAIFFISLIFLPSLFSLLPPPKAKHTTYMESGWMLKLLNALTTWTFNHRPAIYGTTIVVCAAAVLGVMRLKSVGHIVDDLPKQDKVYQDLKFFENNFHGVMPLEIVLDTRKKNGVVSIPVLEKMSQLNEYLHQFPEIGHSLSISEGVKFVRQAYYDGDSSSYSVPNMFDASFLQPYLRMKNNSGSADANDKNNMFAKLVSSFMDSTRQKARISINMADVGSIRLPVLLDSIRHKTDELFDTSKYSVTYTGTSIVFLEGSKFIINSLRDSLALAFIMIFACMIVLFRSIPIVLISFVVNVVPLLITAGVMGWMGVPLKPSTVLVFSIALGITVDVTIRFLVNFKQELEHHNEDIASTVRRTIHDTGLSIIYTSLILTAGFGVFCLSQFDGTKSLGFLTSLTLLVAMVTNLTLQPALLLWIAKTKDRRNGRNSINNESNTDQKTNT